MDHLPVSVDVAVLSLGGLVVLAIILKWRPWEDDDETEEYKNLKKALREANLGPGPEEHIQTDDVSKD